MSMNNGSSNRPIYDTCNYQKRLYESTSPLKHQTYLGYHENTNKCRDQVFWTKPQLVDVDSELSGRTRPLSNCDQYKYNPKCKRSDMCWSTFDKDVPVVFAPELCPIVHNNIPKVTSNGLSPMISDLGNAQSQM